MNVSTTQNEPAVIGAPAGGAQKFTPGSSHDHPFPPPSSGSGSFAAMAGSAMGRWVMLAGLLLLSHSAFAANLFTNADFELATYNQTFGSSTDTLPDGWTNSPPTAMSNLNVFANGSGPGAAENGTHYIAFQSAELDGTQDCLNQVISTVPGQKYTVSFWVAMTASSGTQFGLSPEWDSGGANDTTMGASAFYYHPTNSGAVPYTFFSFTETASKSSTSIYFHGADATGAVLLDNVSAVQLVPEPASLGLAALLLLPTLRFRPLCRRV